MFALLVAVVARAYHLQGHADLPTTVLAGRHQWAPPLCALCCRARIFKEPVKTFICHTLPEYMRDTSDTELVCEDLKSLSGSDLVRVIEWLANKVDGLRLECAALREAEEEVGGPGHAAFQVDCHHDTRRGRGSGEELGMRTAAQQWDRWPS